MTRLVIVMACLICFHYFLLQISIEQTVLELTIEHVFNCLEKLFVADDIIKNDRVDSNLQSANRTDRNSTQRGRLSPKDTCYPSNGGE